MALEAQTSLPQMPAALPHGPSRRPARGDADSAERLGARSRSQRTTTAIAEVRPKDPTLRRDRRYRRNLVFADVAAATLALVFCTVVVGGGRLALVTCLAVPLIVLASKASGLYDRDALLIRKMTIHEMPQLFQLATLYTLVVWLLDSAFGVHTIGPASAIALWGTLWVMLVLFRRVGRIRAARAVPAERLLVIGDAATYGRLSEKLEAGSTNALLVGRLSMHRASRRTQEERPVDEGTVRALVRDMDVHRVLIVPSQSTPEVTAAIVRTVKAVGVRVSIVPNVLDVVGSSVVFDDISGMTVMGLRDFALSRSSRISKRALDLAGATLGLLLLSPVLLAIAAWVKLDSKGPVFFRQERVGRGGQRFHMTKFRTMVVDAEARKGELMAANEGNGHFKIANDPRITGAGRFLRRTSLDELPQLFNVLTGQMSLVGPRPLIHSEDATITGYDRRRLDLTPGMTGHWQIMGSARVPMHEMVKIDYLYVTTWSLFEDVKILLRTVPYVLARRGM
jgi:exopolysaccharide biosynthesis polyprenyl glycosylphosphotransferase